MAFLIDFEDMSATPIKNSYGSGFCKNVPFFDQVIIADGNIIAGIEAKE